MYVQVNSEQMKYVINERFILSDFNFCSWKLLSLFLGVLY